MAATCRGDRRFFFFLSFLRILRASLTTLPNIYLSQEKWLLSFWPKGQETLETHVLSGIRSLYTDLGVQGKRNAGNHSESMLAEL
jgi:hypothetical protein